MTYCILAIAKILRSKSVLHFSRSWSVSTLESQLRLCLKMIKKMRNWIVLFNFVEGNRNLTWNVQRHVKFLIVEGLFA